MDLWGDFLGRRTACNGLSQPFQPALQAEKSAKLDCHQHVVWHNSGHAGGVVSTGLQPVHSPGLGGRSC